MASTEYFACSDCFSDYMIDALLGHSNSFLLMVCVKENSPLWQI